MSDDEKHSLRIEENKLIIDEELEITLWVDTDDKQGIEPTDYEWLDEGAFGLYDREKEVGVQILTRRLDGGSDE